MHKILAATSRGQITLPKEWRDQFDTQYFEAVLEKDELILRPLKNKKNLEEELEEAWQDYKQGKFITHEALVKKYGL